tara:strand:+ start:80 stop:376 length:297 start_codon:yes stop_codon:yes gene_type:complete
MSKKDKFTCAVLRCVLTCLMIAIFLICVGVCVQAHAKPPTNQKSKFYDFNEQLIDGEIRKPTQLYVDARARAKFDRLLRLKKSFLPALFSTSKSQIFK